MSKIKYTSIHELMLINYEINVNELKGMSHTDIKDMIDTKLSEESVIVYRLDENLEDSNNLFLIKKIFGKFGNEIHCKVQYKEGLVNKVPKNKIRIVAWEALKLSNVSVKLSESIDNLEFTIRGNNFGCMDDWGYQTFTDYSFISNGKKLDIYVDSESHGAQVEKVVYFINSKDSCISIRDLDNNENFSDELIEVFNEIF